MQLRVYGGGSGRPTLLIVPAPIKRAYVWDLMPGRSAVRQAIGSGFNVGLIEWTEPERGHADRRLDDYAHRLIDTAAAALMERCGARTVLLAGHSLGGTLAAIFAAVCPRDVQGLVLIEAPLRFGPGAGPLGSLARLAPWTPDPVSAADGRVSGSFISALGVAADPLEFLTARWLDALASSADPDALAAHLRVVHWTLDEFAMPGRLFAEIAGRLCRSDEFHRRTLVIAGRHAAPEGLSMPVLAVLDGRSRLVPPQSVLPTLEAGGGARTVCWRGEETAGAALRHVGALVGSEAHRSLWPRILDWARMVWEDEPRPRR